MDIKEEVRNGRVINKDVVEKAAQQLAEKRNEKLTKEFMRITIDAEFNRKRALLDLQANRDKEDPIKACLKAKEANENAIKEGKITPEEFRQKDSEIEMEKNKELRRIDDEYYTLRNQLHKQCYDVLNEWDD